jgi:nicotinamide-nucleotide amidase
MDAGVLANSIGLDVDLRALLARMDRAGLTVAAAESLTGGLLLALLTEIPGSSAVVRGGLVVYATDLKHSLAGVDAELLAARGPVDPDVAIALAEGARTVCGAGVGLGLTGVAGPEPQDGIAVGTFYVAISAGALTKVVSHSTYPAAGAGGRVRLTTRERVRHTAIRAAVQLLDELTRSVGR